MQYSPTPPPAGMHTPMPMPSGGSSSKGPLIGVLSLLSVVVLGAGIFVVVFFANGGDDDSVTADGDPAIVERGLVYGDGPVQVDVYLDYSCGHCRDFDAANNARLATEAAAGTITIVFHPMGMLDSYSSDNYSTRAAAASACAAAEGGFVEYSTMLLTTMPEMSSSHDNATLAGFGDYSNLSEDFADCVQQETYRDWVADVTGQAMAEGVVAVPYVLIDGVQFEGQIHEFDEELDEALA